MKFFVKLRKGLRHILETMFSPIISLLVHFSNFIYRLPNFTNENKKTNVQSQADSTENMCNNKKGLNAPMSNLHSTPESDRIFKVQKFKLLSIIIVIILTCYHGVLHLQNNHSTCNWLLGKGRFQGYGEWQSYGCMIHKYSAGDSNDCMKYLRYWQQKVHFVFVGDSRVRQLYLHFVAMVTGEAPYESLDRRKVHSDLKYHNPVSNMLVEFFWCPFVDEKMEKLLEKFHKTSPRLLVIASTTWSIKVFNASSEALDSFKANLTRVNAIISKYRQFPNVVWMLQDPVSESHLSINRTSITNRQINLYNRAVYQSIHNKNVKIWSSNVMIAQAFLKDLKPPSIKKTQALLNDSLKIKKKYKDMKNNKKDEEDFILDEFETANSESQAYRGIDEEDDYDGVYNDGLHLTKEALHWDVQILYNLVCNEHMNYADGDCCTRPEQPTPMQVALASIFALSTATTLFMCFCNKLNSLRRRMMARRKVRNYSECIEDEEESDDGEKISMKEFLMTEYNKRHSREFKLYKKNLREGIGNNSFNNDTHIGNKNTGNNNDNMNYSDNNGINETIVNMNKEIDGQSINETSKSDDEYSNDNKKHFYANMYQFFFNFSKLGLLLVYFFICDRTTFFMKENKYYTHVNFFLPFTYLMVLGLFFTESSQQTQVLNRNQTDEWKGWMQIVILIYHLTGASKVLYIYMQIRVMVSAYLFLSAFGHFWYFFTKSDFSLHRLLTVLFRLNFLVFMLCLCMNRIYQSYYFIPLASFWFVVLFLLMAIPPRINNNNGSLRHIALYWLVVKVILLVLLITLLYSSEVLFDKIFLSFFFKPFFASNDESINGWRFRWTLDRYSSAYGLIFAILLACSKSFFTQTAFKLFKFKLIAAVASFLGIVAYIIFTGQCMRKEQCNETHSYVAFVPIICYIVLRNVFEAIRNKFSFFFAFFGKISLELFIGQYHIWLAADTNGILVLVPDYPVLNLVISSLVFVCICHEMKSLTSYFVEVIVSRDSRVLWRNVVLIVMAALAFKVVY